jgi:small-conductance mechanosensitive channel
MLLLYLLATAGLSLPGVVTTLLLALLIFAVIWLVMRAVGALADWVTEQSRGADLDTLSTGGKTEQQRRLTYLSVGRRVALLIVVVIGVGVLFSQFRSLETLGISMIASASVGAVLLGIAAQPVLGNLLAGLQIALAKPVRIGDRVQFEGHWGHVEDITFTFLLVRTWDDRRLVIPLRYFITHPFENWTMRDAHMVRPVVLHADYTVDVPALREHFAELLQADDAYDGESEAKVEVIEAGEETLEIRCLCSAADPSAAWDLQCRMREQMVAYLAEQAGGRSLPRQRVTSAQGNAPADADPADDAVADDDA